MRRLRSRDGCPWDREQTLDSLKRYLVEECYELLDAIDSGDADRHRDELGDLLLQLIFQCQIRTEQNAFTFNDVADTIGEKLVRRHPHVYGDAQAERADDVAPLWESIKADEKRARGESTGTLDGVPRGLPALRRARKLQSRAARVGFDWPDETGVVEKVEEELAEVKTALQSGDENAVNSELGDLLFAVVNLCRFRGAEAEELLDASIAKFVQRFREVERRAVESGRRLEDCSPEEMDRHWEAAKRIFAEREMSG